MVEMSWNDVRYVCNLVSEPVLPVPASPADKLTLYSQRNPLWAGLSYAAGITFSAAGCLVVALAMLVTLVYNERIEPPEVAKRLRDAYCFIGSLLSRPSQIPIAFPRLKWDGVLHYRDKPADMAVVAREVAENGAVIAEVAFDRARPVYLRLNGIDYWNQHFVLVTRVVGSDVEIADPWTGELVMLTGSRYFKAGWPKEASRAITGLRLVGRSTTY